MADSVQMKLIFRLDGIGFSLPVNDLMEIREIPATLIDRSKADSERLVEGSAPYREGSIPIVRIADRLGLQGKGGENRVVLVLSGSEGPWGAVVDRVEGVFSEKEFLTLPLVPIFMHHGQKAYEELVLWRGEPLVCWHPGRFEQSLDGP